jgi:hypothetical protein
MVSVLTTMDQEHRFKAISLHSRYEPPRSPRNQLTFDHDANSSLLDMQYQQQLESLGAAHVSDNARQQSPSYNTASSPSTSSVDIYLEHPSGFASHMDNLAGNLHTGSPLQGEPWSPEHHFTQLLGSQMRQQPHHRASAPRPLSLLSSSAPCNDTLFDYPFPSTPTNSVALQQSSYATSPTRSTVLCAELDNINIADGPDTYGTSIDSAASSSYSFGLQTPPIAVPVPNTTPAYKSPSLKNDEPETSQATPTHTAQKP